MWYQYLWWPAAVVIYYWIYYWISVKNNTDGGNWWIIMLVYSAVCPLWIIVSRITHHMLFDGLLYDSIMVTTFIAAMVVFNQTTLTAHHWTGIVLVVIGLTLIKL